MISSDDYYMLANSFEIGYYTNNSFDNITFNVGYLNKMAGVWDSGANGTEFASMSDASYVAMEDKANVKNGGVAFVSAMYDKDEHKVQAWNYYATDLYNTFFVQYDFVSGVNGFRYDVAIQAINFKEVGKLAANNYTKIDYTLFAGKFDGYFDFGLNFATAITKITDGEGQGATLGAWGGYSYFTGGFNFHFFEAGSLQNAALYKAQIGYDLEKIGLKNSWIGYRHVYSALDSSFSKNAKGEAQNAMNTDGVKFTYSHSSGATFSALYEQRVLEREPDANSLRIIAGFKF
ncbi:MAG: hypothetical protein U9N42_00695 [Campylobacterota bacterium]|nr:hypothetical protein [Campylobacterota bacterium]